MFTLGQYYVTLLSTILLPKLFQLRSLGAFQLALLFHMPHPLQHFLCFLALLASLILYYPCGNNRQEKNWSFPLASCIGAPKSLSISLLTGMSFVLMR